MFLSFLDKMWHNDKESLVIDWGEETERETVRGRNILTQRQLKCVCLWFWYFILVFYLFSRKAQYILNPFVSCNKCEMSVNGDVWTYVCVFGCVWLMRVFVWWRCTHEEAIHQGTHPDTQGKWNLRTLGGYDALTHTHICLSCHKGKKRKVTLYVV